MSDQKTDVLKATTNEDGYHIDFVTSGHDIALESSDGVKFQTHTFVLKTASGVFRDTLSLPQPAGTVPQESVVGPLQEDARTINAILRMISGMEIPALDKFDDFEKVLIAAEKWDMPGPFSIIRRIALPQAMLNEPLRLYVLACRIGWIEAAKTASTYTLDLDLDKEDFRPLLHRMDPRDLLKLLDLRRRRRDALLEFLQTYPFRSCSHEVVSTTNLRPVPLLWEQLKLKAFIAMDRRPSSLSLVGPQSVIQAELRTLGSLTCNSCGMVPAHKLDKDLPTKLSELPKTIEA